MVGFVNSLDEVNAIADAAPGFVWRLQLDDDDMTPIELFGADVIPNMSLWTDLESLRDFAFRSAHREVLARRKEWFRTMQEAYAVLWWVPAGQIPTLGEGKERLEALRRNGPGPQAFTFRQSFEPG
jgi:hypothetical protein